MTKRKVKAVILEEQKQQSEKVVLELTCPVCGLIDPTISQSCPECGSLLLFGELIPYETEK
jgi:hypothetical protein